MAKVREQKLHQKAFILVGVGPLASAKTARWMRSNVPGVHIPDDIIRRLEGAQNQKKEGKRICIDLIQQIREEEGVAGVHVMAYRQEEYVSEIITDFRGDAKPAAAPAGADTGRQSDGLRHILWALQLAVARCAREKANSS